MFSENKGSMWLTIFIFWMIYLLLYSTFGEKRVNVSSSPTTKQQQPPPTPPSFSYDIKYDNNDKKLTFSSSLSSSGPWNFEIPEDFIFDANHKAIVEKDGCFGKLDGYKFKATGKKLYDYLQKNEITFDDDENNKYNYNSNYNNKNNSILSSSKIDGLNNFNYYFSCRGNQINDLYICPPGTFFNRGDCSSINICTGQKDGKTFPDSLKDSHYYQECENGKPIRKRCKPESFFYFIDSCRSEYDTIDICKNNNNNNNNTFYYPNNYKSIFPISRKKYIRCLQDDNNNNNTQSVVENCPDGMSILPSWDKCYPDQCIDCPEGFKKPMPNITDGKFSYSPGYYVCGQNGKIKHTISCSDKKWDFMKSDNGNLTHLPMVFDSKLQKCTIPIFCRNVQPIDDKVIVPAHEFTKYMRNWKFSETYDSLVGFTCNNNNNLQRIVLEPGKKIHENRIVSACDTNNNLQKYPIANEIDKYFDCNGEKIVTCGSGGGIDKEMFSIDTGECIEKIIHAHTFKNLPIFRLKNLSPYTNWIKPFNIDFKQQQKTTCSAPESKYINNYNICSHPDCEKFPFLKQNSSLFILLEDNKHFCKENKGKISKKKYFTEDKLHFWSQRHYEGDDDDDEENKGEICIPGQRIQSGNFLLDSTIFATCDYKQPFVFCPSSSTKGIRLLKDIWACEPNQDDIIQGEIPANTWVRFFYSEVSMIKPENNAAYRINKDEIKYFSGNEPLYMRLSQNPKSHKFEYWSDKKSEIFYRNLQNYPPNTFISNGILKYEGKRNMTYLLEKQKFTKRIIDFLNHDVRRHI